MRRRRPLITRVKEMIVHHPVADAVTDGTSSLGTSSLSICVFGNQDNNGYRLTKWLRARGHDAHLFVMTHWESARSDPAAIDTALAIESNQSWMHEFDNSVAKLIFGHAPEIGEIEQTFDVVLVAGSMAMTFAHRIRRIPVVCLSLGPGNLGVIRMWDHYGLKYRLFWTLMRFYMRKSVRVCHKILTHSDPEIYSLNELNQLGKELFYGLPEDVRSNRQRVDAVLLEELTRRYQEFQRVFLWLSRVDFRDQSSPMYKGTDKFLRAAARVIGEGQRARVIIGNHGRDADAARKLVSELGIEEHVDWVPHLPFRDLLAYLSIPNAVVFDELTELNVVSSGMSREALSVGAVVVRSSRPVLIRAGYGRGDVPIHHALTEDDVYAKMKLALGWNEQEFKEEKARAVDWAERYLDADVRIDVLVGILGEAVYCREVLSRLQR